MLFITEESEIKLDKPLQVMYFYTTWQPFHKKFLSMIEKIETKYNLDFSALDVDFFSNQCSRFNIDSVPTVVIFKDGIEIKRITGVVLFSAFKNVFVELIKEKK
jgi:thioredoxin-like negative regulator of GroEL